MSETTWIGRSVVRTEGRAKVTGEARYVDDVSVPGMLHGVTVRAAGPRGRIKAIHYGEGIPWDELVVVTAADVPGKNVVALLTDDQPFLADALVQHPEEAVVLLAHEDRELLERARRAVRIELEPLPAVFDLEASLGAETVIWGDDNVFKSYLLEKGDLSQAMARADVVIEGEYTTAAQEQLYIENNGMIARASPGEGVTVWGSLQCPYYVHAALVRLFGLSAERVRVIQLETGGGFGGKEDYPSLIAGHAALLAWKAGRPVKLVYDRAEDMVATTKRHPSRTRHRWGVKRDGTIVAMDIEFTLDGGAYNTLSPVVLSRGTIHAAGPYDVGAVRVHSRAVATSTPPHGAFRGFGAPQSIFAVERHMDVVARTLGLTPATMRRRNFLRTGRTTATGQVIREPIELGKLLDRALSESQYVAKRERFARENPGAQVKRGIGLAAFMHGAGFTGSGEKKLGSRAGVELTHEGHVRVLASSTEIGQGRNTVFAQIVADALGVDLSLIEMAPVDTALVPDSGPTVASRTTMVVGQLVLEAAQALMAALRSAGRLDARYDSAAFQRAASTYVREVGPLVLTQQYQPLPGLEWDDVHYRGDAYGTFAWAVYVAEVEVDVLTYEARVVDFTAVQEVGRVVNPILAEGQIEGGVVQGLGYALYENVVWREGRMANGQLTNYIIPTAADVPPIRVVFLETPYERGPGGAKGIGELPLDGPAPAIVNALEDALGVSFRAIPVLPEDIAAALRTRREVA